MDAETRLDKLETYTKQLAADYRGMERSMTDVDARLKVIEATSALHQKSNEQHQQTIDATLGRLDTRVEEFKTDLRQLGDSVHNAMRSVATSLELHMKDEVEGQKKLLYWVLTTLATALSGIGLLMFTKVFNV